MQLMNKVYSKWARSYKEDVDTEKQNYCSICLEDFDAADQIVELRCDSKHIFHVDCIK